MGYGCVQYTLYFIALLFFGCAVFSVYAGIASNNDELIASFGYETYMLVGSFILGLFFLITAFCTILAAKKSFCLWGLLNFIFTFVIGAVFLALGGATIYFKAAEADKIAEDCSPNVPVLSELIKAYQGYRIKTGSELALCSPQCKCGVTNQDVIDRTQIAQENIVADGPIRVQDCEGFSTGSLATDVYVPILSILE